MTDRQANGLASRVRIGAFHSRFDDRSQPRSVVVPFYDHSGYDHSGYDHSGYDHSGYDHSGYDHSGYDHSG
jgi:hypothetical protein